MIVDSLANYKDYCVKGSLLEKGFEFLRDKASADLPDGRIEIQGDRLFALIQSYATVPASEKKWEAHNLYADIQYVVKGREIAGYLPRAALKVVDDQTPKADVIFYAPAAGVDIPLEAGSFCLFYPQDGHKPGCRLGEAVAVKKIVVKVRVKD